MRQADSLAQRVLDALSTLMAAVVAGIFELIGVLTALLDERRRRTPRSGRRADRSSAPGR